MSRTLTTYFSLISPWSYLGHATLVDIARRHEAEIIFRPMDLGRLFSGSGGLPLANRHPLRQAYRDIELQRWREARGISLNLRPAFWPFPAALADQVVVTLVADGVDPDPFIRRAFAGIWAEERNFADEATVAHCLTASGFDAAMLARARNSDIAATYVQNTEAALAAGVFGAPTTLLDGEPFWGQDRLDLLDQALVSGRGLYTA